MPDAGIVYSDEDKIDSQGLRTKPYFKCDWDPWLFCGHNLITHLGVYHRALLTAIGGFRTGYEGSQDYDLAARAVEHLSAAQIVHVPRVLQLSSAVISTHSPPRAPNIVSACDSISSSESVKRAVLVVDVVVGEPEMLDFS